MISELGENVQLKRNGKVGGGGDDFPVWRGIRGMICSSGCWNVEVQQVIQNEGQCAHHG